MQSFNGTPLNGTHISHSHDKSSGIAMAANRWYGVLESSEVKEGKIIGVKRLGEQLAFWRDEDGDLHCVTNKCAHRGASLDKGKVVGSNIQCPFHGLQYDASGRCVVIPSMGRAATVPANFKVQSYPTREKGGWIFLWWGPPVDEYPPVPFFNDIDERFSHSTHACHWTVHYSRAIENQLDVSHLPFVHHDTIGRSNATICDGPFTEIDGEGCLRVWVSNRKEDGKPALSPAQLERPARPALLHFNFPNVWQNRLGDGFRVVAIFAPVDESKTVVYVSLYQSIVRLPGLRWIMNVLSRRMNKVILHQDKNVVLTQVPVETRLNMGENLFPADKPIILYRQRREELLKNNEIY